jgi:hypothetical protein
MAQPEAVHTPIEFETYKRNKINILKTIILIKGIHLRVEKIESIKKEKKELRLHMKKLLASIIKDVEHFQGRFPQTTKKALHTEFSSTMNMREHESRLDDELTLIQEKLEKLSRS